ncbi:MAG: PqqD family protein [Anaerolineales bacterium]|nr:PqqD family protein [Anaerolineales bacterium]MCB9127688.1 PqqD family protein [Ardenticatenales bacterium]
MEVQLDHCYRPNDGVASRVTNDEMVLVDLREGIYHGLNPVGADIWRLLDGERSLQEVVKELSNRYPDTAPDVVQNDAMALVQTLLDHALVKANR